MLRAAVAALDAPPVGRVAGLSGVYKTAPVGETGQPAFLNAVAVVETSLPPRALLDALLSIERRLGRVRDSVRRWGPRTIDLDLLALGEAVVDEPGLKVPHPRLGERRFVLAPLADVAPGLVIPGRGRVADLLAALPDVGVARLLGPEALR